MKIRRATTFSTFILSIFFFSAATLFSQSDQDRRWTIADLHSKGSASSASPQNPVWSPDGKKLTYMSLQNGDLEQVDVATGKESPLVAHEKLASILDTHISEKDRDHRARYRMSSYLWAPDSAHLLFDAGGDLYLYDLRSGTAEKSASSGEGSGDDPKFSPDGSSVSYLKNHNLYVHAVHGGTEAALTNTTDESVLNGEVDWVYEEELDVRSNYFWAPDSKHLAYLQMNEQKVPTYPIVDWIDTHASTDEQRYPQPGDPNPDVKVGIVSAPGGATRWISLPVSPNNDYIPRFGWVNAKTVWVETLTRDHKHLSIYFADIESGKTLEAFAETAEKFFDESYDVEFLSKQQKFLLTSWRDGHNHIYEYSFDTNAPLAAPARMERQLTSGVYEVDEIEGTSESTGVVFYRANEGDPRGEQLFSIHLDGKDKRQITKEPGHHQGTFADDGKFFGDVYSNANTPPVARLCSAEGKCLPPFFKADPLSDYKLRAPANLTFKAADGTTDLYATLLMPEGASGNRSVPLIVNPYGGPHAQSTEDRYSPALLFDLLLTQHGFAVLHADNRGMGGRGRDYEYACYRNFGPVQLADQLAVLDQTLAKYPQLDAKRVGFWGWSWGGSFTLYALTHTNRFAAGVAVAPVTDWRNYDSIYTERYLGLPSENEQIYKDQAVNSSAANLKGKLLLVHGTGDDNVHFQNSVQFIQAMIAADVPYDFQIYPKKTHSISGADARLHLFTRILKHFEENLKDTKLDAKQ